MLKKALIAVSAFAILLMLALSFLTARFIDQKEIARVQQEMVRVQALRDSVQLVVALSDSLQRLFQGQIDAKEREADSLRRQVARLEQARAEAQLSVRRLRRPEDLTARFSAAFPEITGSDWGITEVVNEETGLGIQYLLVPLWFSETFIIEHRNAGSYQRQRDSLLALDEVQRSVSSLKDSLLVKEQDKTRALQVGYDTTFALYRSLNRDYIDLLKQPPSVHLFPSRRTALVSGALGIVLGAAATAALKN